MEVKVQSFCLSKPEKSTEIHAKHGSQDLEHIDHEIKTNSGRPEPTTFYSHATVVLKNRFTTVLKTSNMAYLIPSDFVEQW
jgi:hypothetical protein